MKWVQKLFSTLALTLVLAVAAQAQTQEILIGYSGPLSGLAAEYGQDVFNGIELAVNEINAAGGISVAGKKYSFKLERLDDRADPTQAVNNARRLQSMGAVAVFNPVFNTAAAMMNINEEKDKEFLVMAFTSTPRITDMGNKLMLVTPGPFVSMVEISAQWALEKGWKRCAMLATIGPYGEEWRNVFRKVWERRGGTITIDRPANYYTETDYSAPITAALATKPDVLLIGGPSATTALMIEQCRTMGFKGGFIMIDQAKLDYIETVMKGTKTMGNLIGSAGAGIPPREGQNVAARYRAAYKRAATAESTFNFAFVHALARSISAAGTTTDVYKIRQAFPKAAVMYATESPMEVYGVQDNGRFLVVTATQTITNGVKDKPMLYFWWPKTKAEYEAVEKTSQIDRSIPRRWLKTQ
ncbi:MAG TPA: ABC transporter substrate-binding protein [Smithellaceae bacterium]|nr:ABC transporter substrate-binding protein [Smithellaceae bacterium]